MIEEAREGLRDALRTARGVRVRKRDVRGVASDAQPIDQSLVPRTLFYVKGGIIHSVSETQRVERKRKKGGRGDVPGHGQIEVRNSMGSRKARETSRATVSELSRDHSVSALDRKAMTMTTQRQEPARAKQRRETHREIWPMNHQINHGRCARSCLILPVTACRPCMTIFARRSWSRTAPTTASKHNIMYKNKRRQYRFYTYGVRREQCAVSQKGGGGGPTYAIRLTFRGLGPLRCSARAEMNVSAREKRHGGCRLGAGAVPNGASRSESKRTPGE